MTLKRQKESRQADEDQLTQTEKTQSQEADEEQRKLYRAAQYQRLIISVLILSIVAWILGKQDVSIVWIFALLVWIFFWWRNTALRIIELAAKEAEIHERRKKAFANSETVEWLNFLINRWFVFSDRSLLNLVKSSLDPILEQHKPSYIGGDKAMQCYFYSSPGSMEVRDLTLGNRTPYLKHVTVYDNFDDLRKIKASELNFNHPPEDLMTRGTYKTVIHLEAGLTSPEARFIIRIKLGNKGFLAQTSTDVAIEDVQINGKLQLVLLFNQNIPFPHLAAVSFCFMEEPDVSFNIRLLKAVQLMEFPLIRQWITQMLNDYLKIALVDPGRVTIPLCDDPDIVGRGAAYACGVLTVTITGGSHGKVTDDPFWATVKIGNHKRYTKEILGDTVWRDHVSLLVYNLHSDKLEIKLKGRRKLGTKYTVAEHVLSLSTLCLESNPQQEHLLVKPFRPATLLVQVEYTPLPVIEVNNTATAEDFDRNYTSRLRTLQPQEVSGVLLVCVHSGQNLVPMAKNGLSDPYCVIYENSRLVKKGEAVKGTLSPVWDTMVEILVADFTQVTLSFVVLDKDSNSIKMRKDDRGDFMGSCSLSLTEVTPVLFKKNLDLLYKVKGSGMMKAGKLCVSAIFRPVHPATKSEIHENSRGLPEGEPPGQKDAKTEAQTLEVLMRAERGTLEVNIYQGRNLIAKDVNGKSDPFVTIKEGTEGREKFRTRVILNTLNPVWNDTATVAMPGPNGLLVVEVWDKDPLTQERMGQVGFTTKKLKDLGKAPHEKRWIRLRGVKSGELQLSFKHIPPQAEDEDFNSDLENTKDSQPFRDSARGLGSIPSYDSVLSQFPEGFGKNTSVTSWDCVTQRIRTGTEQEECGDVISPTIPCHSYPGFENQGNYRLKDWPRRKQRRLHAVVDTVRSLRCKMGSDSAQNHPGNSKDCDDVIETNQKYNRRKFKSPSLNFKWRKFGLLKERRQRSASEGRLSELYTSSEETEPVAGNETLFRRRKTSPRPTARRTLSASVTGSVGFNRRTSSEKVSVSLPNSPASTITKRNMGLSRASESRSSASCSTNSQGSTPSRDSSCPACSLARASQFQDGDQSSSSGHAPSYHERLIL